MYITWLWDMVNWVNRRFRKSTGPNFVVEPIILINIKYTNQLQFMYNSPNRENSWAQLVTYSNIQLHINYKLITHQL